MKMGLQTMQEFNFIALRFGIAFLLSGVLFYKRMLQTDFKTLRYSFVLGSLLFLVFSFVMAGVESTSTSNAGFLVSLTVIFVPLFSAIFLKKRPDRKVIIGVCLAITGIGLLTLNSELKINQGDIFCILCAVFYAIHIIVTGKLTHRVDSIVLGIFQLGFCALWGLLFSLTTETPMLPNDLQSWIAILALGILCSSIGFVVQTVAQKHTTATHTGLIFSLEPVFAALFAFLFVGEILPLKGYIGAFLVLLGVINAVVKGKELSREPLKKTTSAS